MKHKRYTAEYNFENIFRHIQLRKNKEFYSSIKTPFYESMIYQDQVFLVGGIQKVLFSPG